MDIYIFNLTLHVLMGKYSMVNNGLRFCDRDSPDTSGCLIPLFAGECRKPGYRPKNSKNNVYTLIMTLKFLTIDEFKLYQPATNHIEPPIS